MPMAGKERGLVCIPEVGDEVLVGFEREDLRFPIVLGAFWMLEEYASAVGRGYAQQVADDVERLPRTVVLSRTPLGIQAPGVREERIGAAGSPEVRYRTTGLRLLARSGGKVLLGHDGWSPRTGTVIVLSDDDQLGWEFSR